MHTHVCSCGSRGLILSISVSSSSALHLSLSQGFPAHIISTFFLAFHDAMQTKWDSEHCELNVTSRNRTYS